MAIISDYRLRFWGVRGSLPTSGPHTQRYGGHTPCIEANCGGRTIVLDCGTGALPLGQDLTHRKVKAIDILISHCHIDHLMGFPFFAPAYDPQCTIRIWSAVSAPGQGVKDAVQKMMEPPLFPLPLEGLKANISFNEFEVDRNIYLDPEITISSAKLNHPGSATGYRISYGKKSVCYITDIEHEDKVDDKLRDLVQDTDVLIYDTTYSDEEYVIRKGWGHSTWSEGMRLAELAEVGVFVAFHHDPSHDDDYMDELAAKLNKRRPNSIVAHEGMILIP